MNKKSWLRVLHSCSENRKSKCGFADQKRPRRRKLAGFVAFVVTLAIGGAAAEAQQPKTISRIGYISIGDPARDSVRTEGIRRNLRELGHTEGQNIATEYRYSDGRPGRNDELAAELARLKVTLIVVAGGDTMIRSVMNATKTIPIVITGQGTDPVKAGFIESLSHPGGNVTGLTSLNRDLGGKRLELLKDAVPKLKRIAFLHDPALPGTMRELKEELPSAARALKLTLQPWEVRTPNDLEKVFAALNKQRPDGVYVSMAGSLIRANEKRIVGFSLKSRLPSVYDNKETVNAGGLMYYGADVADSYRLVAWYVDKILGNKGSE